MPVKELAVTVLFICVTIEIRLIKTKEELGVFPSPLIFTVRISACFSSSLHVTPVLISHCHDLKHSREKEFLNESLSVCVAAVRASHLRYIYINLCLCRNWTRVHWRTPTGTSGERKDQELVCCESALQLFWFTGRAALSSFIMTTPRTSFKSTDTARWKRKHLFYRECVWSQTLLGTLTDKIRFFPHVENFLWYQLSWGETAAGMLLCLIDSNFMLCRRVWVSAPGTSQV